jgi:chemotaxis protein MotB
MRIFRKNSENESEDWLILSDVSMGGFIIFLVIAIAYIARHSEVYKREGIYDSLKHFGQSKMIDVLDDGTIRFSSTSNNSMFKFNGTDIQKGFQAELIKFLPGYLDTLLTKLNDIKEVRIEGHTDNICNGSPSEQACYLYNLELSQKRAYSLLEFVLNSNAFKKLSIVNQTKMRKIFVAVGYSYSIPLDKKGKYTKDIKTIDLEKSRRVDFKILIKSPENE